MNIREAYAYLAHLIRKGHGDVDLMLFDGEGCHCKDISEMPLVRVKAASYGALSSGEVCFSPYETEVAHGRSPTRDKLALVVGYEGCDTGRVEVDLAQTTHRYRDILPGCVDCGGPPEDSLHDYHCDRCNRLVSGAHVHGYREGPARR